MKRIYLAVIAGLFGLATLAWANPEPEITVKLDDNADFSNYRTFGVVESGPPLSANAAPRTGGRSQANDGRRLDQGEQAIRDTILEALKSRGMQPNEDGNPDFFIGYDALVLRFDDPMTRPFDLIRPSWGNTVSVQRSYSVFESGAAYEGRLTIFVVDARSRDIVWSATAEGTVRSLRNIVNNVHTLVADMMSRMPGG